MGLDLYFYKKGFVELDIYGGSKNRELFEYITEKCGVIYGDEEYAKEIALNKRQVNKILRYLNKNNDNGEYSQLITDIGYAKENNQTVYISANW